MRYCRVNLALALATALVACTDPTSPRAIDLASAADLAMRAASFTPLHDLVPGPSAAPAPFVDARLAVLPATGVVDRSIVWGSTGRAVAWIERATHDRVVVNDRPGPRFDHVTDLSIARDGVTPVYVGNVGGALSSGRVVGVSGGSFHLVVGERQSDAFSIGIGIKEYLAPRFVYTTYGSGGVQLVVEGKAGPPFRRLGDGLAFLPDGRPVYTAWRDRAAHLVIGDEVGPAFDRVAGPRIAANGTVAYVGSHGRLDRVVVDGKPSAQAYDDLNELEIGPDGTVFYQGIRGGQSYAVFGAREIGRYEAVAHGTFGANGRLAFMAQQKERWAMVAIENGAARTGPWFSSVEPAVFSPDGAHVAYVAHLDDMRGGGDVVIRDGRRQARWPHINGAGIVWSADGRHLAYSITTTSDKVAAVLDEKVGPEFEEVGPLSIVGGVLCYEASRKAAPHSCVVRGVTPSCEAQIGEPNLISGTQSDNFTVDANGRHLAYRARRGDGWVVVVDGTAGALFDEVWPPRISPDGKQLGYGARKGRELWWHVVSL